MLICAIFLFYLVHGPNSLDTFPNSMLMLVAFIDGLIAGKVSLIIKKHTEVKSAITVYQNWLEKDTLALEQRLCTYEAGSLDYMLTESRITDNKKLIEILATRKRRNIFVK